MRRLGILISLWTYLLLASAGTAQAESLERKTSAPSAAATKISNEDAKPAPEINIASPDATAQDAFSRARAYQMEGKSKEALEAYTLAIINEAGTAEQSYSNRALIYEDLNQFEFAKQDLSKAIEINPDFDFAWASRAEVNFSLGNYDDCIKDANEAIRLNPDNAFAYAQLACAYGNQGKKEEALKAAQECVSRESRDNFLRVLGTAFKETGKIDEAIEQYTKSIELAPNVDAFEERANCYCRQGKYDLALADYDEALKLKPNDGHFLGERALVLWLSGKESEAQDAARIAVNALLKCAHSYSALVIEDANKQLPAVACADYLNRSLKASDGNNDGRLYFLLADIHTRMKEKQQAAADIDKGVSLGFKRLTP
jgi:Tetratricopeptide repeat.